MNILTLVNKEKLYLFNSYLLVLFGLCLPITIAGANMVGVIILLNWFIIADFKKHYYELKENRVVIAGLIFLLIHLIGLFFSNDLEYSLSVLKKEYKWLALPIFMVFIRKEHIKYYLASFILALILSSLLSHLILFELIEPIKNATIDNPIVFIPHISYNPLLCFSIYLLIYFVIFDDKIKRNIKFIFIFFIFILSFSMFTTIGRAGQIMYFTMIIIVFIQYYKTNLKKAFLLICTIIPILFMLAYTNSDIFKNRVDIGVSDIQNFHNNQNTSLGLRLTYILNSIDIIKENPFFGVGTGNFKIEYPKVHEINTPHLPIVANQPHNMYILVLVEYGIVGFFSLLFIFYSQIKTALSSNSLFIRNIGIMLPLLFMLILMSDIYLFLHYTTWMFIYFSAIAYKHYDKKTIK